MYRVLRGVDDVVRKVANLREQLTFLSDSLAHVLIGQRVWPPRLAVTPEQNVVVRFQEEHRDIDPAFLQLLVHARK